MPIFLNEDESKKLGKRRLILPPDLVKHLKVKQKLYSGDEYKASRGYKRLNSLISSYNDHSDGKFEKDDGIYDMSFSDAKRIVHDLNGMNPQEYDMIGGDMMRSWLQNSLESLRNGVREVNQVPEVPKTGVEQTKPEKPKDVVKVNGRELHVEEFSREIRKQWQS